VKCTMLARSSGVVPGRHRAAPRVRAVVGAAGHDDLGRPVCSRATSMAYVQTSDPFFPNTVQSANGVRPTRVFRQLHHSSRAVEAVALAPLCRHRLLDFRVAVADHDRAVRAHVVDVLVPSTSHTCAPSPRSKK